MRDNGLDQACCTITKWQKDGSSDFDFLLFQTSELSQQFADPITVRGGLFNNTKVSINSEIIGIQDPVGNAIEDRGFFIPLNFEFGQMGDTSKDIEVPNLKGSKLANEFTSTVPPHLPKLDQSLF